MANNLTKNIQEKIANTFIDGYEADMVTLDTIDRSTIPQGSINNTSGTTFQVKRPHQWKTARTSGGDLTAVTKSDIISATATARVQDYFSEIVEWTQVEEALQLNSLDTILAPIAQKIGNDCESDFNEYMLQNSAHQLGDPTLSVDRWSDVAQISTFAKDIGMPAGKLYGQVTPDTRQKLADAQIGLFSDSLIKSAYHSAMIPKDFGGAEVFSSNSLVNFQSGTTLAGTLKVNGAVTQTYIAGKDTYQTTMTIDGFTSATGTIVAGTVIQLPGTLWNQQQTKRAAAGVNGAGRAFTAVVAADATISGNQVTVTLNGPAFFEATGNYNTIASAIANDDDVNIISGAEGANNVPNLFYHRKAFGYLSVKLPKLHSIDSTIVNFKGMSFRIHKFSDGLTNQQLIRFDFLPAYVTYNPLLAGRFFGNA